MTHLLRRPPGAPLSAHAHGGDDGHRAHGDHEHPHSLWGALRRIVSEPLGGHPHDPADQIDDALQANAAGRRALLVSLAGLGATALLQLVVVAVSGSVALLGDTLHNVVDALTAVPLLVAFGLARRAPTARYTYGFGRAEDLAGLFVVVMVALSGVIVAYESVSHLLEPRTVTHLPAVALAALVGFAGNELVARYRIRVGRRIGSAALVADGLHARTDGFTSLAVLVGAGGVAVGWDWADPVVGLVIAVAIAGVLRSALREVGARLMDSVDPGLVARARESAVAVEEVSGIPDLRLRWSGHALRAEADVEVAGELTVTQAESVARHVEEHLRLDLPHLREVAVRVRPRARPEPVR